MVSDCTFLIKRHCPIEIDLLDGCMVERKNAFQRCEICSDAEVLPLGGASGHGKVVLYQTVKVALWLGPQLE